MSELMEILITNTENESYLIDLNTMILPPLGVITDIKFTFTEELIITDTTEGI